MDERTQGGKDPRSTERTLYVVLGVLLVATGLWLLVGHPMLGWPWLEPFRVMVRGVRQVAWPLTLVLAGVLLVLYSRRPGARLPTREARLTRSRRSKVVAGVIGGLGEYFGIDPALLRIGVVVAALLLGVVGQLLVAYIVAAIVIPQAPDAPAQQPAQEPPAPAPERDGT